MSTSAKGFSQIEGSAAPNIPGDINAAELFVEDLIGETVATAGDLPTTGNWVGRTIWVQDAAYLATCTATPHTWSQPATDIANVATFGTGWSATNTTNHKPRVRMFGSLVLLYGAVTAASGASGNNILTVPSDFRPPTTGTRFIGSGVSSAGTEFQLAMSSGLISIPSGYIDGSIGVGATLPLVASWWMD